MVIVCPFYCFIVQILTIYTNFRTDSLLSQKPLIKLHLELLFEEFQTCIFLESFNWSDNFISSHLKNALKNRKYKKKPFPSVIDFSDDQWEDLKGTLKVGMKVGLSIFVAAVITEDLKFLNEAKKNIFYCSNQKTFVETFDYIRTGLANNILVKKHFGDVLAV